LFTLDNGASEDLSVSDSRILEKTFKPLRARPFFEGG
jgi:hypothetical protein